MTNRGSLYSSLYSENLSASFIQTYTINALGTPSSHVGFVEETEGETYGQCSHWVSLRLLEMVGGGRVGGGGSSHVSASRTQILPMSGSAGRWRGGGGPAGEDGLMDRGGVEGGEGNRAGWGRERAGEGGCSCLAGGDGGADSAGED